MALTQNPMRPTRTLLLRSYAKVTPEGKVHLVRVTRDTATGLTLQTTTIMPDLLAVPGYRSAIAASAGRSLQAGDDDDASGMP